jgi:TetR/AcrR family fatty acid metabolism transcriptional regulator
LKRPATSPATEKPNAAANNAITPELRGASKSVAKSDKYQRILDAAVEVIAEHGYFNSPVSAIAERAGVADGTIYLYFKSKDHVLRTALDVAFARFHTRVKDMLAVTGDPRRQLEAMARMQLEAVAGNRALAVLMQTEVRQSAKFFAEFSQQHLAAYITMMRDVIRAGQQQGVFRAEIPDALAAHCIFGALDEIVGSWVFSGRQFEPVTAAASVMGLLLQGINTAGNKK